MEKKIQTLGESLNQTSKIDKPSIVEKTKRRDSLSYKRLWKFQTL